MRRDGLKLSQRHRRWFYGVFGVLFLSGTAWWVLKWRTEEADPTSWVATLAKIHGGAAMLALVVLGTLVPMHIRRGWRIRRNRLAGATLTVACGLLVVSGYLLYYAGGESLRKTATYIHEFLGVGLPLLIAWHIARGRRSREIPRA